MSKRSAKTKAQLVAELEALSQRVAELEASQAGYQQAEIALRESERRFHLLAECLPGLVYIFDLTTRRIIYMNRQGFLGYTWDDLTGPTSITANLHPDDRSWAMEHWQQLAKGKPDDPNGVVYRVLGKSGQWEWVRQHITVMTWEDQGKPACILVTLTVETEREHAAKMVRESEERYRHITEALTDYIYGVRVEGGRVVETTHGPACVAVTGYTSEDFAANPDLWLQMVDEGDRQAVLEQAHRLLAGKDVQPLEHRITRKDGVKRWVRNTPIPYFGLEGGLLAYDGLIQDITERKQVEEALAQEHNLLRALVDSMPDRIYAKDAEGRFTLKNEADAHAMGASSTSEVIGKTDFDYYPRDLAERFHADDQQVIRSGQPLINREEPGVDSEGKACWILTTKVPLRDGRGRVIGLVGVGRDITERKRAQEEIELYRDHLEEMVEQQTAELKAANEQLLVLTRMKDEFVANVSHELRTPLASLKVHHHLLGVKPEEIDTYLDRLQRDTNRLEHLIEGLLSFSRLDQDRTKIDLELVNLAELAETYVTDRASLAEQSGLTLICADGPALPAIQTDPILLGQALGAVLTNALNYTPDGGRIEVSTCLRQADTRHWAGLSVSDTGPGIPPDEITRITERFFRGQAARQSGKPGTGLGLAIVKDIMDRLQGRLVIESEGVPGKGASFTLWLPANGDHAEQN